LIDASYDRVERDDLLSLFFPASGSRQMPDEVVTLDPDGRRLRAYR